MIHIHPNAEDTDEAMVLYRNVLAEGVLSWGAQFPDRPAANALGPQTFDYWSFSTLAGWISSEIDEQVGCDTAAIIGHNLGSIGARVAVQARHAGVWSEIMRVAPTDDRDILMLFPRLERRVWRIWIGRDEAVPPHPAVSIAMIGPRLTIPYGVTAGYTPINLAREVDLLPNITRGGQFLGNRVQRVGAGTSIPLAQQRREWIESAEVRKFIRHYNDGNPFIWASDPELLPDDMAYCWRSGDTLSASYGAGAVYGDMSMQIAAFVGGENG